MAISTDFNYDNLLSLGKAKLVKRFRLNFLGSQELILDYQGVTAGAREDCTEYLETNRLTLTDPKFGFRTYEGTWYCVDILYNEDRKSIRQRFKIDSSLQDDVSQRSANGSSYKDYYWRVVDPARYKIPEYKSVEGATASLVDDMYWVDTGATNNGETVYNDESRTYALWNKASDSKWYVTAVADMGETPTSYYASTGSDIADTYVATTWTGAPIINTVESHGEEWAKIANDNGDGTYDITITRKSSSSLSGSGALMAGAGSGTEAMTESIFVTNTGNADIDGEYTSFGIDPLGNPHWRKPSIETTGTSSVDLDGVRWINWVEYINSYQSYTSEDGVYAFWYTGTVWKIAEVAFMDGTPTDYFESSTKLGTYTAHGGWTGTTTTASINGGVERMIAYGASNTTLPTCSFNTLTDLWYIFYEPYPQYLWRGYGGVYCSNLGWGNFTHYTSNTVLVPSPWLSASTSAIVALMSLEIGRTGAAYSEDSEITNNSTEQKFVSDGGTVPDPVQGEIKSISNVPLSSGLYRTTITTKTALPQRLPALYGMFYYTSKGIVKSNGILHGKNQTEAKFNEDLALLSDSATLLSKDLSNNANSVSVSMNASGLLDYTILSNYRV